MNDTLLTFLLNLRLPDQIHDAVARGAAAQGLDVDQLLEAHRSVYVLGFYEGMHWLEGEATHED